MNITDWKIFDGLTNWQIFEGGLLVVVFLFILFKTMWTLLSFMRDEDKS